MDKAKDLRNELVIEGTRIGVWDWNIQTGETIFNERWAEILGYRIEELQPISIETWMRFAHPEDLQRSNELLQQHFIGETEYYDFESRMKHKDGHWVWVHDRGKVFEWDDEGSPLRMCGSHIDITEQKELELALKKALREKDVLLSEVHHRVKNNLQLIASLARLKDRDGKIEVSEIEDSISSIAQAHEAIYKTERFDKISLTAYLSQVIQPILIADPVRMELDTEDIQLSIDLLIPIGLVITELVNNSLKHAFRGLTEKKIMLSAKRSEEGIAIVYSDNGCGYSDEIWRKAIAADTYGLSIVRSLIEQIDGRITFSNDGGTRIEMVI